LNSMSSIMTLQIGKIPGQFTSFARRHGVDTFVASSRDGSDLNATRRVNGRWRDGAFYGGAP
ncbi:MAG: hypothetical protein AAGF91_12235, partial [Actinomycetota bacterium]